VHYKLNPISSAVVYVVVGRFEGSQDRVPVNETYAVAKILMLFPFIFPTGGLLGGGSESHFMPRAAGKQLLLLIEIIAVCIVEAFAHLYGVPLTRFGLGS
jgi:hypothetical protein